MDKLIREYADRLRQIYDDRTAGDHTFTGVLFHFSQDVERFLQEDDAWNEHERRKLEGWADYHMI